MSKSDTTEDTQSESQPIPLNPTSANEGSNSPAEGSNPPAEGSNPTWGNECHVIASDNWRASITDTGNGYRLEVKGDLTMPTPGFQFLWRQTRLDKRKPPALSLKLTTTKPRLPTIQVITQQEITHTQEIPSSTLRKVNIFCADTKIAQITDFSGGSSNPVAEM